MRFVSRSRHFQPSIEGLSSRLLLDGSATVAPVAAEVVTPDDSSDASGPVDTDATDATNASGPVDTDATDTDDSNQNGAVAQVIPAASGSATSNAGAASGPVVTSAGPSAAPPASGPTDDGSSPMDPIVITWASGPDDGSSPMDPVVITWASGPTGPGDTVIVDIGDGQAPAASGPVTDPSDGDGYGDGDGDAPPLSACGPTSFN